jgi:ubiquinone/menaquinone biosynthesis C-methylase UbiE
VNGQQAQEQRWARESSTDAPDQLLYLDTYNAAEFAKAYKRQLYELLQVREGHYVLDVGCGPGDDVRAMAQIVGCNGKVVGVDNNEKMIAEVRRREAKTELSVEFCLCDAHQLSFGAGLFDRCHADRVFQHLEDPAQALGEVIRVTKPGGLIVAIEPDWETLALDVQDRAITRKIAHYICDQMVRNGWMGRQLPNLFKAYGLIEISVVARAVPLTDFVLADRLWGLRRNAERARKAGVISTSEAAGWIESLERASQTNRFFGAVTGFAVCGQKP